jgi:N-acetyl-anhydromuramyl-L-alanine amidase AmpD
MIETVKYILPDNNFSKIETNKKRIVIGNSFSINMLHYIGWLNRYNGNYKKTSSYTIKLDGTIHQHFDPKYYSEITGNKDFDESTISILLENEGWLSKDLNEENRYITYIGNIYNRVDEVFVKKWRNNKYWAPYTQKQMESAIYLTNKLCDEFEILKDVITHNTKIHNGYSYEGILYKGNLNSYFTDVNPSWDFLSFKEQIEKI